MKIPQNPTTFVLNNHLNDNSNEREKKTQKRRTRRWNSNSSFKCTNALINHLSTQNVQLMVFCSGLWPLLLNCIHFGGSPSSQVSSNSQIVYSGVNENHWQYELISWFHWYIDLEIHFAIRTHGQIHDGC